MRDVPWEDIFKVSASIAASEFCEWVRVGVDVYIPHFKYKVKLHSCPWFSAIYAAIIAHKNHFFRLYQQNKSFKSKIKLRQVYAKPAYANKTKESVTSQNLGPSDFWGIANSFAICFL